MPLQPLTEFEATGTHWRIDIDASISTGSFEAIQTRVRTRVELFEATYSRFRPDSLISHIAQSSGSFVFPKDAAALLELYLQLYRLTEGAFTPLIGQVLVDAGYDASYSLIPKTLTPPPRWEEAMSYDETSSTLTTSKPIQLDFGGAGKGYIVDLVGLELEALGIHSYTVDAGGDIRHRTSHHEPIRVGLEHPQDPTLAIGVATLGNGSICGSSGNRRRWDRFHHTINPHTLSSPQDILAIWTTADITLLADALTTCLFFVKPEILRAEFNFEYLIVYADLSIQKSPQFPAEMFG